MSRAAPSMSRPGPAASRPTGGVTSHRAAATAADGSSSAPCPARRTEPGGESGRLPAGSGRAAQLPGCALPTVGPDRRARARPSHAAAAGRRAPAGASGPWPGGNPSPPRLGTVTVGAAPGRLR